MKRLITLTLVLCLLLINNPVLAKASESCKKVHCKNCIVSKHKKCKKHKNTQTTHGINGEVTPKSIGAGALSLLIWPGIGQLMNDEENTDKVLTHAVLGLTGIFRIWSCYDGVVDRKGGVWDNRI